MKNMDNLERFVQDNKSGFNDAEPPALLWNNIERELHAKKEKKSRLLLYSSMSAAAVALLCLGVFIGTSMNNDPFDEAISQSPYADFQNTQQYYAVKVNNYMKQIEEVQPNVNIEDDLKQLDEVYEELRSELIKADMKNKEQIINAMIDNYHTKVGMLERILDRANKKKLDNSINNKEHEKLSI